jgi:hypothetical protein
VLLLALTLLLHLPLKTLSVLSLTLFSVLPLKLRYSFIHVSLSVLNSTTIIQFNSSFTGEVEGNSYIHFYSFCIIIAILLSTSYSPSWF